MSAPSFTYSGNVYTAGVAGAVDFPLISTAGNAIPYLESSHIHVYKSSNEGATWTELARPAEWDFATGGTVARLAVGIAADEWIKIQRITPSTSSYINFQGSSLLTAEQLNNDTLFSTYLNQEGIDKGEQTAAVSTEADATAQTASAAAAAAVSDAAAALTASATAVADAATALATANTAASDAGSALATANAAATSASSALTAAATAVSDASSAVTTAGNADSKADQAIASVANVLTFAQVADVTAIPAIPAFGDAVEVADSTGIESFTPLSGLPNGFVGDSGLSVRLVYVEASASWLWNQYFPSDPEQRYIPATDIGVTVQAHDATILNEANIGVTVQPYDATILNEADIGVTVQAHDADTAKTDVEQTFTAKQTFTELSETVYVLASSGTIGLDPANGSVQTCVLTAAATFTDDLESGQTVVLMLENGTAFTVEWPATGVTWVSSSGNTPPSLTPKDTLVFWKVGSMLFGTYVGSYV